MPILGVKITTGNYLGAFRQTMMLAQRRIEYAALKATDQAATQAKSRIREAMQSAGLGRLGNAIASTSDLKKGQIKRYSGGGFRASGVIYIRSGSARTRGAIESYTVGADIRPVRSRWLWIATDQIPRVMAASE